MNIQDQVMDEIRGLTYYGDSEHGQCMANHWIKVWEEQGPRGFYIDNVTGCAKLRVPYTPPVAEEYTYQAKLEEDDCEVIDDEDMAQIKRVNDQIDAWDAMSLMALEAQAEEAYKWQEAMQESLDTASDEDINKSLENDQWIKLLEGMIAKKELTRGH